MTLGLKNTLADVVCALVVAFSVAANAAEPSTANERAFPPLAEGITSFGAVINDGWLYGGHKGSAHSYSIEEQSNEFRRVSVEQPEKWEDLPQGLRVQGMGMVAAKGKLYRLGGFSAQNHEGEDSKLVSTAQVDIFDPATSQWTPGTALPEARSSFDAVVVGDQVYVVGGWALRGEEDSQWHDTAYVADLSAETLAWKPIPNPGFQRRALALGELGGKVYAIGGMQSEGGVTTKTAVLDPATSQWSEGPTLPGDNMEGFGSSAFQTGGKLYVSTIKGNLLRLSADGGSWEQIATLKQPRFFHRMLPLSAHELVLVGGADMKTGKVLELETVHVD
jgi:N-acetylneuraminic acid mutarotase